MLSAVARSHSGRRGSSLDRSSVEREVRTLMEATSSRTMSRRGDSLLSRRLLTSASAVASARLPPARRAPRLRGPSPAAAAASARTPGLGSLPEHTSGVGGTGVAIPPGAADPEGSVWAADISGGMDPLGPGVPMSLERFFLGEGTIIASPPPAPPASPPAAHRRLPRPPPPRFSCPPASSSSTGTRTTVVWGLMPSYVGWSFHDSDVSEARQNRPEV
mmetsp:Transcript_68454/g.216644  ORF Transcript_68454/g.216644 Transcript_68454/m.216644 type:complete len:218 (+) Transcript_68454:812-1465(+)